MELVGLGFWKSPLKGSRLNRHLRFDLPFGSAAAWNVDRCEGSSHLTPTADSDEDERMKATR